MYPQNKSLRELKDIVVSASLEFGKNHEQVVMLRALLDERLKEHGSSVANTVVFNSSTVNVTNEPGH